MRPPTAAVTQATQTVVIGGESLVLHHSGALYWPAHNTLFVADLHLGKEHAFGRAGVAIPGGASELTLKRLFSLCDQLAICRLFVLGDFMHAAPSRSEFWLRALSDELERRPALHVSIVAGNHDKPSGRALIDARISWYAQALALSPFVLKHEPAADPSGYVLCGHLHPAWRLSTARRTGIRAPVFWIRQQYAVLPAFGAFTGGAPIKPDRRQDRVFMTGNETVIEMPLGELPGPSGRRRPR